MRETKMSYPVFYTGAVLMVLGALVLDTMNVQLSSWGRILYAFAGMSFVVLVSVLARQGNDETTGGDPADGDDEGRR